MRHQAGTEQGVLWGGLRFVGCVQHAFLSIHWVYLPTRLEDRTKLGMFKSTERSFKPIDLEITVLAQVQWNGWAALTGSSGLPRDPPEQGGSTPL